MKDRKFTHPDDAKEGHEWVTSGGSKVRIYATDGSNGGTIHGAYKSPDSGWVIRFWDKASNYSGLEDAPVKHVRWLNVYEKYVGQHKTRESADFYSNVSRVACIRVEYEEGQLDE